MLRNTGIIIICGFEVVPSAKRHDLLPLIAFLERFLSAKKFDLMSLLVDSIVVPQH